MHERDPSFGPVDAAAFQVAYEILRQDGGKSAGYERFPEADAEAKLDLVVKLGRSLAEKWRARPRHGAPTDEPPARAARKAGQDVGLSPSPARTPSRPVA